MPKKYIRIIVLIGLLAAVLSGSSGPAAAQGGGNQLCVSAPSEIAKGNTETINIEIDLAVTPPDGYTCVALDMVETDMGVGITGARTNFLLDPSDDHEVAGIQNPGSNKWTWSINAVGEENTSHNMIVFASVADDTRRVGYRSVALVPVRITIREATGSVFDQILRFLDGTKEILLILTAVIVAAVGLRGQIKGLLSGDDKKPASNNK
ncbi:MAG: hypothetical protein JXN59_11195 [Anaerolineae bacterium]|nr:hypothetical protein [Anaerolineae bacterium]